MIRSFRNAFLAALAVVVAGCAGDGNISRGPVVTVQCNSFTEDFQRSIEQQCPGIDIRWVLSTQAHSNYFNHLEELPDILSIGSFYFDEKPAPYVRDISSEVSTADFSRNVIDNFRNADGTISWLPVIGNAYFILANKELFSRYDIALPRDYNSLVAADKAFKEHGIDGMAWGLSKTWLFAPALVAQVLAADLFNSYDGMAWRKKLHSSDIDDGYTLDDTVWPEVFARFEGAFASGLIDATDMNENNVMAMDKLRFGKAAMVLCSSNTLSLMKDEKYVVIPFIDAQGSAWVPLYINQSFAVSSKVSDNRLPAVMEVLKAIQSSQSQKAYNDSRGGAFTMSGDASGIPPRLESLRKPAEEGFSFLLYNDTEYGIIDGFGQTLREMFAEGLSAEEAYRRGREKILEARKEYTLQEQWNEDPESLVFSSDVSYPMKTDRYRNHPAASCIVNTILASMNNLSDKKIDVLVALPSICGAPIEKGDYFYPKTESNIFGSNFFFLFNTRRTFYPATMTVAELIQYLNNSFYYFHRIDDGLPIMAGASYSVDKYENGIDESSLPFKPGTVNAGAIANHENFPTRYVCKAILRDGQELPLDTVLEVVVARENVFYMTELTDKWESSWVGFRPALALKSASGKSCSSNQDFFYDWVASGKRICEPTRYLYINEVDAKR